MLLSSSAMSCARTNSGSTCPLLLQTSLARVLSPGACHRRLIGAQLPLRGDLRLRRVAPAVHQPRVRPHGLLEPLRAQPLRPAGAHALQQPPGESLSMCCSCLEAHDNIPHPTSTGLLLTRAASRYKRQTCGQGLQLCQDCMRVRGVCHGPISVYCLSRSGDHCPIHLRRWFIH